MAASAFPLPPCGGGREGASRQARHQNPTVATSISAGFFAKPRLPLGPHPVPPHKGEGEEGAAGSHLPPHAIALPSKGGNENGTVGNLSGNGAIGA